MQANANSVLPAAKRTPWNKGKLTGAKPPLRPKHVWSIRTKLQVEGRTRDLAMFNLAIDSKLRGCDVVALKVEDVLRADTQSIGQPCDCPSSDNLRLIRHFAKRGSGSSGVRV
jgi:hypothetical protein